MQLMSVVVSQWNNAHGHPHFMQIIHINNDSYDYSIILYCSMWIKANGEVMDSSEA